METTLAEVALGAPTLVRVAVGVVSGLLVVAGARWYRIGLYGAAFAAGCALVATTTAWLGTWLPAAADPTVGAVAAFTGGVAMALGARTAHKAAMLAAGALTGLVAGAVVVQVASAPLWVVPVGLLAGAISFPWLYQQLLKVLTPAVGAAGVAWAIGLPGNPLVVGGLWAFGAAVQLAGPSRAREPDEDDG